MVLVVKVATSTPDIARRNKLILMVCDLQMIPVWLKIDIREYTPNDVIGKVEETG